MGCSSKGCSSKGGSSRELHEFVCPAIEAIEDMGAEDDGHATLAALARQPTQEPAAPHYVEAAGAREVRGGAAERGGRCGGAEGTSC